MRACRNLLIQQQRQHHYPFPLPLSLALSSTPIYVRRPLCISPYVFHRNFAFGIKRGDWSCGNCKAINFLGRETCAKCHLPKADVMKQEFEYTVAPEEVETRRAYLETDLPTKEFENKICELISFKGTNLTQAKELYKKANDYPLPTSSRFYRRAVDKFAKLGSLPDVIKIIKDVGTGVSENSNYVHGVLVIQLLIAQKLEAAVAILSKMSTYNLKLVGLHLSQMYIEAAKIPNGIETIRDLKLSFGVNSRLNGQLVIQAAKRDVLEAVDLFLKSAPEIDIVAATVLLNQTTATMSKTTNTEIKEKYKEAALKILAITTQHIKQLKPDSAWFVTVVGAMAKLDAHAQIKPLFESIKNDPNMCEFQLLFDFAFRMSSEDLATCVLDMVEMLSNAALSQSQIRDFFTLVVAKVSSIGNLDLASNLINQMTSLNVLPDDRFVSRYVEALPKPGTLVAVEGAETTMRSLSSQGYTFTNHAYENIIRGYLGLNLHEKALEVMQFAITSPPERGLDPFAYHDLLGRFLQDGKSDLALTLYKDLLQNSFVLDAAIAKKIFQQHPDLLKIEQAYNEVIGEAATEPSELADLKRVFNSDISGRLKTKKEPSNTLRDRLARKVQSQLDLTPAPLPEPRASEVEASAEAKLPQHPKAPHKVAGLLQYSAEELIGHLVRPAVPSLSPDRVNFAYMDPLQLIGYLSKPGSIPQIQHMHSIPFPILSQVQSPLLHHTPPPLLGNPKAQAAIPTDLQIPVIQHASIPEIHPPPYIQPPNNQEPSTATHDITSTQTDPTNQLQFSNLRTNEAPDPSQSLPHERSDPQTEHAQTNAPVTPPPLPEQTQIHTPTSTAQHINQVAQSQHQQTPRPNRSLSRQDAVVYAEGLQTVQKITKTKTKTKKRPTRNANTAKEPTVTAEAVAPPQPEAPQLTQTPQLTQITQPIQTHHSTQSTHKRQSPELNLTTLSTTKPIPRTPRTQLKTPRNTQKQLYTNSKLRPEQEQLVIESSTSIPTLSHLPPFTVKLARHKQSNQKVTLIDLGKLPLFDMQDYSAYQAKYAQKENYLAHLETLEKEQKRLKKQEQREGATDPNKDTQELQETKESRESAVNNEQSPHEQTQEEDSKRDEQREQWDFGSETSTHHTPAPTKFTDIPITPPNDSKSLSRKSKPSVMQAKQQQ